MSGRRASQCLVSAPCFMALVFTFLIPLLSACQAADHIVPRQMIVEWPERRLMFIADERTGSVRALYLGAGAPVLAAQTRNFERSTVRDIKLDQERGQLWVLGADSVYVHQADSLGSFKRISLDGRSVAALRIENGTVVLLAADNVMLGRIDTKMLLAVWRPVLDVHQG